MDPVPPVPPPAPLSPNLVFEVDYETLSVSDRNVDLQGKGTFTVRPDGTYWFTGKKRGAFSREEQQLSFTAADIVNVGVSGRAVWFSTGKGNSGASEKPFIFMCRNETEAREVARLLPAHVDEHFMAAVGFHEKLRQLPGATTPFGSVTNIVIALNVIVFVAMVAFLGVGLVDVTDLMPYVRYGANNGAATTGGEWWRLVTSMFMHYGVIHLGLNMWALYQTGRLVERLLGRTLYTVTYLASGVGGGFASILFSGDQRWSAGASGAVFGVFGAILGFMLKEKQALPKLIYQPMMKSTLGFAGYNLVFGLAMPRIDNAAHVGGFVVGALFGWLTAMPVDAAARPPLFGKKLRLAVVALAALVGLGVAITPRFDYLPMEEFAWNEAVKGLGDQQTKLMERLEAELKRWTKSKDNAAAFVQLIENELVPFYRDFGRRIAALQLTPGHAAAERRAVIGQFVRLRLDSYDHLARAVKEGSADEMKTYEKLDAEAGQVVNAPKTAEK